MRCCPAYLAPVEIHPHTISKQTLRCLITTLSVCLHDTQENQLLLVKNDYYYWVSIIGLLLVYTLVVLKSNLIRFLILSD